MNNRDNLSLMQDQEMADADYMARIIKRKLATVHEPFTISTVLSDWLLLAPENATFQKQVIVGGILSQLGCTRIRTKTGVTYLPPERKTVTTIKPARGGEPLSPKQPLEVPADPIKSTVCAIIMLAVVAVIGLSAYWIHRTNQQENVTSTWRQL